MNLRAWKDTDAEPVAALHERTVRAVNAADHEPAVIDRWVAEFCTPERERKGAASEIRFVVEDGDTIIGFGGVNPEECKLTTLYVDPQARGKGVGSLLMERLEKALAKQGCSRIVLQSSLSAKTFYERFGYEALRREFHNDWLDSWAMEKEL